MDAVSPRLGLTQLLEPRSIAIVGATADAKRIGGQLLQNLVDAGYRGAVYPINPKYREINGIPCYADLTALPQACDLALVAVNADAVSGVVEQCAARSIQYAIVFSSGFREIGPAGVARETQLKSAAAKGGVRILGPNCLGIMNLRQRIFCGFGAGFRNYQLRQGPVAFVSQSGGFAFSVVALADHEGINFNYIVSTGNEADITTLDLVAEFLERDEVEVVVVYMEGVADGRRLREIGKRALALRKPILIWKVGNSAAGRAAAQSHTASMTAQYRLYQTAFAEGGYCEVCDVHDLVDITRAHLARRLPAGPNVAVITTSGGSGVLIADACDRGGLKLPQLDPASIASIAAWAPKNSVFSNPIDLTAQLGGDSRTLNRITEIVLGDPNIDQLIIRYNAVQGPGSEAWASELADIVQRSDKPVHVAWSRVPDRSAASLLLLEQNRIAWALTPTRTALAAAALYNFAQKHARYLAAGSRDLERATPLRPLDFPEERIALSEHESKQRLAEYGIAFTHEVLFSPSQIAALTALPLRFPLAVKIDSPDIAHKTEIDAVRLDVTSLAQLQTAASEILAAAGKAYPRAHINGLLIAEMAAGTEVIMGAVNDPFFGPVMMFGLGGIFTEILHDVTYRFAPFGPQTAREMIDEIKGVKLLTGYRGHPPLAVDELALMLARLSWFAYDHSDRIADIDLNPVFVSQEKVIVADALIVLRERLPAHVH